MRVLTLVVLLAVAMAAQPSELLAPPEHRAVAGAKRLAAAMRAGDAKTVTGLTLPDLVWAGGGAEKMAESLNRKFDEVKRKGGQISIDLGTASKMGRSGDIYYLFVPYVLKSRTEERSVTDEAFYLAISDDAGENWHYVDGIGLSEADMSRIFVPGYRGDPPFPSARRRVEEH